MSDVLGMAFIVGLTVGVVGVLVATLVFSVRRETAGGKAPIWKNFGLSMFLSILFFVSWTGHGLSQWQEFTDNQREHNQGVAVGDFAAEFASATLENWQSEFLQLFSFVVLASLLIHKGSAESRDSDDRIEAALQRVEEKLGTSPTA